MKTEPEVIGAVVLPLTCGFLGHQAGAGGLDVHKCVSLVCLLPLFGQLPRTGILLGKEELRLTDQAAALWPPGKTACPPLPPAGLGF